MKVSLIVENVYDTVFCVDDLKLSISSDDGSVHLHRGSDWIGCWNLCGPNGILNEHNEELVGIAAIKHVHYLMACRAISPLRDFDYINQIQMGINKLGLFYQPSGISYDDDTDKPNYGWQRIPFENGSWELSNQLFSLKLYGSLCDRFKIVREWHNGLHYAEKVFVLEDNEHIYRFMKSVAQNFMEGN